MTDQPRATWIWYPDDYEIWLHQKVSVLRKFRGYICPPHWQLDSAYPSIKFRKTYELHKPEQITISVQGDYVVLLDDDMTPVPYKKQPITTIELPAGRHQLLIHAYNDREIPALYVSGETIRTDDSWEVSSLNGRWVEPASWTFHDIEQPPSSFPFSYTTVQPKSITDHHGATIIDFGQETFGYVTFLGVVGSGQIHLYYGESLEEALAGEGAETFDSIEVNASSPQDYKTSVTRAFRYIQVKIDHGVSYQHVEHQYEYLPIEQRGSFRSSDDRLNRIWEVSARTLHINMREFLYDGMKRDRWVWSGDANLGFLINHYSFFDQDVVKRTLVALRGKDPVEIHINTIMDYTFYWFLSLYDYYLYTGDKKFIHDAYPKLVSLMEFCLGRRNENGMLEGYPEDWVFIDWASMERRGELSAEQILFCRCLEVAAQFAKEVGDQANEERYARLAEQLRQDIFSLFWDDEQGGIIHGRLEGQLMEEMYRYPNIFAIRFGYLNEHQQALVRENVLKNPNVQLIKTPFMRFFELDALALSGEHQYVLDEIRDYWNGMLELGATTFWEEYDPSIPDEQQYDMYHDKYRKSLCHAWGAAPIYLLGKYQLGVTPISPGYSQFLVEPQLCDLEWMEGKVPMPNGELELYMDWNKLRVTYSGTGEGILRFRSESMPTVNRGEMKSIGGNRYEVLLSEQGEYEVMLRKDEAHG